jgi:hypothetical protein
MYPLLMFVYIALCFKSLGLSTSPDFGSWSHIFLCKTVSKRYYNMVAILGSFIIKTYSLSIVEMCQAANKWTDALICYLQLILF